MPYMYFEININKYIFLKKKISEGRLLGTREYAY